MNAHILVDADACPVKDETYRVAARHGVPVTVVANSGFRVPMERFADGSRMVTPVIVSDGFDAADDHIVELAEALVGEGTRTIVVTADIPLADRALKAGAVALKPTGREWDAANIGGALATRSPSCPTCARGRKARAGISAGLRRFPRTIGRLTSRLWIVR